MNLTKSIFLYFILIVYSFFIITCKSKKDNSTASNTETNIGIDSAYVESFLKQNAEFKPQRKKILKFYGRRDYSLAWYNDDELLPQAGMLINLLHNVGADGLQTNKYNFANLKSLHTKVISAKSEKDLITERKDLDLMLTASYFSYARDLWSGSVDTKDEQIEWYVQRKKVKYGKTLDAILESKDNPFAKFEPLSPEYAKLKQQLATYRNLEKNGGWPTITLTTKLKKGDTSVVIIQLRKRLNITGDLKENNQQNLFDATLEAGIKSFQQRHGLTSDGVLGAKTVEEMNVPVASRIEQIIINMERWRWVPQQLNDTMILVNIPEYKLKVYEKGKEVWNMNVIVGKAANSTPIFNDQLEMVVFSPYWNVPRSIVVDELLPKLQQDPLALASQNMEVYQGTGKSLTVLDANTIDWSTVSDENLPYQIRQRPGGSNALGKVKFLFPNEYDVYLHDTPAHELFSQTKRGFSHGCIRLEEPQKMAQYLLKAEPGWTTEKIEEAMNQEEEEIVKLRTKVPVFIVYFTSWVGPNGMINFREDIYAHDARLARTYFER